MTTGMRTTFSRYKSKKISSTPTAHFPIWLKFDLVLQQYTGKQKPITLLIKIFAGPHTSSTSTQVKNKDMLTMYQLSRKRKLKHNIFYNEHGLC